MASGLKQKRNDVENKVCLYGHNLHFILCCFAHVDAEQVGFDELVAEFRDETHRRQVDAYRHERVDYHR